MQASLTLIDIAGAIALLLWGTHMVQSGVQRAFGPRLRATLNSALRTRLHGFLAGMGVTAILQSSTATGLMVTGFAAGGMLDLVPALAVMLGANVGTTLIVQVLSFDVASVAPCLILLGVILFRRHPVLNARDIGRVLIGLGLMLIALHQLLDMVTPYEDAPSLRVILGLVSSAPILLVLVATVLTWLAHSSVAVILVVMSLAGKGVLAPDVALALVLGANLGTAVNPLLEGVSGDDPAAKRLPMGNLLSRAAGVAVAVAALGPLGRLLVVAEPDPGRMVADFHTLFNLVLALLFLPALGPYASLLKRLWPTRVDPADPSRPLYLDPAALEAPVVALGSAAREALRLADVLETMLDGVQDAFERGDRRAIVESKRRDDVIDKLTSAIRAYLTAIDPDNLSGVDHRRLDEILIYATNLEQAGDVVDKSLLPLASKRLKRGIVFSNQSRTELAAAMTRIRSNLRTAAALLMTDDPRGARMLAEEKRRFRDLESEATRFHFEEMRLGGSGSPEGGALYLDILRDLKRINAHLVAAAAYPILERDGGLLPSRLAVEDS